MKEVIQLENGAMTVGQPEDTGLPFGRITGLFFIEDDCREKEKERFHLK
jgi:hypothetical protein